MTHVYVICSLGVVFIKDSISCLVKIHRYGTKSERNNNFDNIIMENEFKHSFLRSKCIIFKKSLQKLLYQNMLKMCF